MAESFTSFSKIGVGFNRKTDFSEHLTGDTVTMVGVTQPGTNRFAMYVKAGAAIGANSYCTVDVTTDPYSATSVDGGSGTAMYQNGSIAFAASEYGWLMSTKTVISDATRAATADNALQLLGKTWNAPGTIGITTPSSGAFTTLSATGAVSGAGFTARFSTPGPIGDTTPSAGAFTTLTGTSAVITNAGPVTLNFTDTTKGADLKSWIVYGSLNSNYDVYAQNDLNNASTLAYRITRGTTYNVAQHTWNTSSSAGTAVNTMQLTMASAKTNLTITPPTSSAGLAAGTLYQGAANAAFFA